MTARMNAKAEEARKAKSIVSTIPVIVEIALKPPSTAHRPVFNGVQSKMTLVG